MTKFTYFQENIDLQTFLNDNFILFLCGSAGAVKRARLRLLRRNLVA